MKRIISSRRPSGRFGVLGKYGEGNAERARLASAYSRHLGALVADRRPLVIRSTLSTKHSVLLFITEQLPGRCI